MLTLRKSCLRHASAETLRETSFVRLAATRRPTRAPGPGTPAPRGEVKVLKTSAQRRLGPTVGLLLLSLLVLAIAAPAVLAAAGGSGSSSPPAGTQGRGGVIGVTGKTPAAGTEGRGGINAAVPDPTAGMAAQPQSVSSGTSSLSLERHVGLGLDRYRLGRPRRGHRHVGDPPAPPLRSSVGGVLRAASRRRSLWSGLTRQREGRGVARPARVRSRRALRVVGETAAASPPRRRHAQSGQVACSHHRASSGEVAHAASEAVLPGCPACAWSHPADGVAIASMCTTSRTRNE